MTKIGVLVSGNGTNLQALIDAEKRGELASGKIVCVASNREDAYALERARKEGIPSFFVKKTTGNFEDALLEVLGNCEVEFVVCAGYLKIFGEKFLEKYGGRCINIHPSLLPNFGGKGMYGLKVHEAVLAAKVRETGATVHFVNSVVDGGEIILQKKVDVLENDTAEVLQKRVMEQAEWIILPKAVEMCCRKL